MTKELKDIPIICINLSKPENQGELDYMLGMFKSILEVNRFKDTSENIDFLCKFFVDRINSEIIVDSYNNKVTNAEQLYSFVLKTIESAQLPVTEISTKVLFLATVTTIKIMGGYLPSDIIIDAYKAFNVNAMMLNPEREKEVTKFLISLWANICFVLTVSEFNVFNGRNWLHSIWTTMVVHDSELVSITTNLPETTDGKLILLTFDNDNKKLNIEVSYKTVLEKTQKLELETGEVV